MSPLRCRSVENASANARIVLRSTLTACWSRMLHSGITENDSVDAPCTSGTLQSLQELLAMFSRPGRDPETIRTHLLQPVLGEASTCAQCANPCALGHEDNCTTAERHTISRHNQLCLAMHGSTATVPSLNASLLPLLDSSGRKELGRGDLALIVGNNRSYYDLQIESLSKLRAHADPFDTLSAAAAK